MQQLDGIVPEVEPQASANPFWLRSRKHWHLPRAKWPS